MSQLATVVVAVLASAATYGLLVYYIGKKYL